jgi:hypothetical protein
VDQVLWVLQGGFTRILHSGRADDLMKEMPTFVAQPLPPDKHDHKGYVVLNRPYAINQARHSAEALRVSALDTIFTIYSTHTRGGAQHSLEP